MDDVGSPNLAAAACRFGPDRRLTVGCLILGVAAVAIAVFSQDRAGRLLLGVAALILFAYAVTDLLYFPRLVATHGGLVVRTPSVRATFAWPDVDVVRADARQRLGLRSVTLEIDANETLMVFSRRTLGADPEVAARAIAAVQSAAFRR